ncbi:thymidine phosphorylase [Methylobacterium sp. WL103]|uniref:thymidine phosphorylase n=1 Tax=Methylobacterium sp. WL103 TaxID=2603891 RepID=UPI0011CA45B2|nr:thymidine phosphorylase [Methylobacterium sp. WL103]TXM96760.1 thymidine phosphorylase [Methylobacterium sp. WL103]
MRLPQETIRRKRDGATLEPAEIADFIAGLTDGRVGEGQAAAFAMAVFFQGMSIAERVALTRAMTRSGSVLAWNLSGPVLDKHSTGGIGDAVSLVLAPMVAACGGYVPMISGRGLGHTGGTLDKLASIPGYDATPDLDRFRRVVSEVGCAIIGQTADLAPADRRLYAIRDVTGTVESLDLITASILAKKLAAGLDGLVMDVKVGSGAFMAGIDAARALADSIVAVANGAGLRTVALITDMDAPLASAAGNGLEVAYAIDYLAGRREPRFHAVTLALAAEMLVAGGLATDLDAAATKLEASLASGRAAETFSRMVAALGGPADLMEHPTRHLPAAPVIREVRAEGKVARVATRAIGLAVIGLGGGRGAGGDRADRAEAMKKAGGFRHRPELTYQPPRP